MGQRHRSTGVDHACGDRSARTPPAVEAQKFGTPGTAPVRTLSAAPATRTAPATHRAFEIGMCATPFVVCCENANSTRPHAAMAHHLPLRFPVGGAFGGIRPSARNCLTRSLTRSTPIDNREAISAMVNPWSIPDMIRLSIRSRSAGVSFSYARRPITPSSDFHRRHPASA